MADWSNVDGRTVGGQGGQGVLIESLTVKNDVNAKTKDEMLWLEFGGTAHTVLNNPYAPEQGYTELTEPLQVFKRVDILNSAGKDLKITYDLISRAFDLKPPLEDRPDEVLRFMEDADDSVYSHIVGKAVYFKAKLANGKVGSKPSDFFFDPMPQSKVVEAKKGAVMAILDRVRKAKAAKAAAVEDFAVAGTSDVPF